MAVVENIQSAFNAGEISPRVQGRVDIDKYRSGLADCTNALVLPHGPAMRRSGLVYLGEVKTSSELVRLIPFEFSKDQAYVIEMGAGYARFWMDGGVVVTPDTDTVLLLHMDGKNASIQFTDDGTNEHTVTPAGNAKMYTADYVFGSASATFDGSNDYLSIADHADFNFGSDEFTIDFWATHDDAVGTSCFWYQEDAASVNDRIAVIVDWDTGDIYMYASDGGALLDSIRFNYSTGFSADTWYHFAIIRGWGGNTDDWMICINGVACAGSATTSAITMPNHDQDPVIGVSEDTFVYDATGEHFITVAGTATCSVSGYFTGNGCVIFDGNSDYMTCADHADWDITDKTNYTISFFVRHHDHADTEGYVAQYEGNNNQWGFKHVHGQGTRLWVYSGASEIVGLYGKEIEDVTWHHVALVKVGDDYGIYVDGDLTGYLNDDSSDTFAGTLTVGRGFSSAGSPQYLDGQMADIVMYEGNLFSVDPSDFFTDDSDAAHGAATLSGPPNAGQMSYNFPNYTTYKWGVSSLECTGAGGNLQYAHHADWNVSDNANFTIDCWVKLDVHTSLDGIVTHWQNNSNMWRLWNSHGDSLYFDIRTGNVQRVALSSAAAEITDTDWHHIAVIKVGNAYGLYKDGTQVAYDSDAGSHTFIGALRVGKILSTSGTSYYLNGKLDEFRITHANSFSASPVAGLTDTITIPTGAHTSDADTKLLMHFDSAQVTVPTAKHTIAGDTKLCIRGDVMDHDGLIDEFRISTTARWTAAFSYPTSAYPGFQGGTTYEIATPPWAEEDLFDLKWAQSADTLYVCHPDYNVYKITRTDHDSWTCEEIDWSEPPWIDTADCNPDGITLTGDGDNAIGETNTMAASAALFDDNWVDAYISVDGGFVRVTSVADATHADTLVKDTLSGGGADATWKLSVWSNIEGYGYPSCITFHEDRLVLAGAGGEPLTVRLSESGDYENFETDTNDDDPLSYKILAQKQNAILWVLGGNKLYVGTAGAEYLITGEDEDTPITPTSVLIRRQSTTGSVDHQPVSVGSALLYLQRGGHVVNAWEYDYTTEVYTPVDVSILAEHIGKTYEFEEMVYAQDPNRVVWIRRSDGAVVGLTFLKDQQVVGWHVHNSEDSTGSAVIESIAVIPGDSQGKQQDELWCLVQRTIDGSTVRYIEVLDVTYDGDAIEYHRFSDSCLTYSGNPATTFTGADHLEGEAVVVLADGEWITGKTISSGGFTLTTAASEVTVGLAYNTTLEILTPELGEMIAKVTSHFKRKRFIKLLLMLYETCQLKYGKDTSNLFDVWDTLGLTDATLYTDNLEVEFDGNPEYDPTCIIQQQGPYGFTLLGIVETIEVGD